MSAGASPDAKSIATLSPKEGIVDAMEKQLKGDAVSRLSCSELPLGQKLAVAVTEDFFSRNGSIEVLDDNKAVDLLCELSLALGAARAALTGEGKCFSAEQVDMVLIANVSAIPSQQLERYQNRAIVVKDATETPAMQMFSEVSKKHAATIVDDTLIDSDRAWLALTMFRKMFRVVPMWLEDYAGVVVLDSATFIANTGPRDGNADLFGKLMAADAPRIIYKHTKTQPFAPTMYAVRPSSNAYQVFQEAVEHVDNVPFNVSSGWGGRYDDFMLLKMGIITKAYIEDLQQRGKAHDVLGDSASECIGGAVWCFNDANTALGMLMHMVASSSEGGKPYLSSVDMFAHDENSFATGVDASYLVDTDVYSQDQNPWNVDSAMGSGAMNEEIGLFWARFSKVYRYAWPASTAHQCGAKYGCNYKRMLQILPALANANVLNSTMEDRQQLVDVCDASWNTGGPLGPN
jgi:hypothetical protein